LHLVPDEKFIDAARSIFELARDGAHDFVVVTRDPILRYIRTFQPIRRSPEKAMEAEWLEELGRYSAIFVHLLGKTARRVIAAAPRNARFVWLGWGIDYYHLICAPNELLLPATRKLIDELRQTSDAKIQIAAQSLKEALQAAKHPCQLARRMGDHFAMRHIGAGGSREIGLLNRFEYFGPVLKQDYDAVKSRHPDFTAAFADWNYWTEGFGLDEFNPDDLGDHILLGNSATPENNHLESIELLRRSPLGARRVICPLSYGDSMYGDAVETIGKQCLGQNFIALRAYVPPETYSATLKSCSIVAMNHVRQQALGNILLMLWFGARVFLNTRSPVREALGTLGISTGDIGDLPSYLRAPARLSRSEVFRTRQILLTRFGKDAIVERTRALLAKLDMQPA
jgi:hypothetical protein